MKMKIKKEEVSTWGNIEVVGHNFECADMDNPDGAIHKLVSRVVVELEDGSRFEHERGFYNPVDGDNDQIAAKVEALADRVRKSGAINLDHWLEAFAAYGSKAWRGEEADRRYRLECAVQAGDWEAADTYS